MKAGSKEFIDLMAAFEKVSKGMGRFDKEDMAIWTRHQRYYQHGLVNELFISFMNGYQLAKSLARVDALPLDE